MFTYTHKKHYSVCSAGPDRKSQPVRIRTEKQQKSLQSPVWAAGQCRSAWWSLALAQSPCPAADWHVPSLPLTPLHKQLPSPHPPKKAVWHKWKPKPILEPEPEEPSLRAQTRKNMNCQIFLNNSKLKVPWVHPSTAAIANLLMSFHWQPHLNNLQKKL